MNYVYSSSQELWSEIHKLFSIPDHCSKLVITLEKGCLVTLDATINATKGTEYPITKRYRLVEEWEEE